jgi:hypothetical protein
MAKDRSEDRHVRPRRFIGVDDPDWDEFGRMYGDKERHDLVRQFIAAMIGRPGVKIPRRKQKPATPKDDGPQ